MTIYTKTGDAGTTGLFGGARISKADVQVEAYGTVDELTSQLGFAIASLTEQKDISLLSHVQKELYQIMSVLAGGAEQTTSTMRSTLPERISEYEKLCDEIEKALPPLTQFILPQGGETASRLHVARTVCRRAERTVVRLFSDETHGTVVDAESRSIILQYLNRLSDMLFMLARNYTNRETTVRL